MRNYENRDNRDRNESNNSNGTQLFVARGKNHGMDQGGLIEFIANEANVDPSSLTGPKVLDDFSFITVPHEDADKILNHFQEKAGDGRPLVSKAKRKTEGRSGGFDRDRRSRDRDGFGGGNGGGYRGRDSRNDDRRGNGGGNYNRSGNNDRRGNSGGGYNSRPKRDSDY